MTNFEQILVPFDGSGSSEVALNTAIRIANKFDSNITAVYVKKSDSDNKVAELKTRLEQLESESGRTIIFLHPVGKMYKEVVRTLKEVDAKLIIMGSHGVSGFEEFWIGSDAFRVVSSSPVPVITMQEAFTKGGFEKIIVPIDQSKETRQKIPTIIDLVRLFGSSVHLLGTTKYSDEESESIVRRYVKQSLEILEKEELSATVSYCLGQNIAKATLNCAKEQGSDLIVMMSESEPSSGLFMGSNAQQVVNHSAVPVLTLQPKDVGIAISGY